VDRALTIGSVSFPFRSAKEWERELDTPVLDELTATKLHEEHHGESDDEERNTMGEGDLGLCAGIERRRADAGRKICWKEENDLRRRATAAEGAFCRKFLPAFILFLLQLFHFCPCMVALNRTLVLDQYLIFYETLDKFVA